jgi:hypothetical protein
MRNGVADTPEEELVLLLVGVVALGAVLGSAGTMALAGADYLVGHGILVGAREHPLVAVPGAGGAGLDLSRLAILAGLLLAVLAAAVSSARRAWALQREVN